MLCFVTSVEVRQNLAKSKRIHVCGYFCFWSFCPILITGAFMFIYLNMIAISSNYSEMHGLEQHRSGVIPFNLCGKLVPQELSELERAPEKLSTKWYEVFLINALVYTFLTIWQLVLVMSSFAFKLAYIGACCIGYTQMCQFAGIIFLGIFRYNPIGQQCAES